MKKTLEGRTDPEVDDGTRRDSPDFIFIECIHQIQKGDIYKTECNQNMLLCFITVCDRRASAPYLKREIMRL